MLSRIRNTALGLIISSILSFAIIGNFTVGTALLVVPPAAVVVSTVACSKDQLVASAEDVLAVVSDPALQNALANISPEALAKLVALSPLARDLVQAIKDGATANALQLVNTIFPVIDEIAATLHANQTALGILALANIALHFIINHSKPSASAAVKSSSAGSKAIRQAAERPWGCDYLPKDKRCTE